MKLPPEKMAQLLACIQNLRRQKEFDKNLAAVFKESPEWREKVETESRRAQHWLAFLERIYDHG